MESSEADELTKKKLLVIGGPTASGKTALSVLLARELMCPVVSYDSRQFYKEIPIVTAQPGKAELSRVPHFFIGDRSIHQPLHAAGFAELANGRLQDIFTQSDYCVAVGGSGLYLKAWLEGLDDIPSTPPTIRAQVNAVFCEQGIEALRSWLKSVDPEFYNQVDLNNPRRLTRALEVYLHTGKPYSTFLSRNKKRNPNFTVVYIGINPDRAELHSRIALRVEQMVANGLFEEVMPLYAFRYLPTLQTVGCKEIFDMMEGKYSREECLEQIVIHTRQYARRQLTWYRKVPGIHWFESHPDPKSILKLID